MAGRTEAMIIEVVDVLENTTDSVCFVGHNNQGANRIRRRMEELLERRGLPTVSEYERAGRLVQATPAQGSRSIRGRQIDQLMIDHFAWQYAYRDTSEIQRVWETRQTHKPEERKR